MAYTNAQTIDSIPPHNPHSPPSATERYSALNESLWAYQKKRGRELDAEDEGQPMMKRTRETRDEESRRLIKGNARPSTHAKPIEPVSSYSRPEDSVYGRAKRLPSRVGNSGFKPRNTLDGQPHTSRTTPSNLHSRRPEAEIRRQDSPALRRLSSEGGDWAAKFPHVHAKLRLNMGDGSDGPEPRSRPEGTSDDVISIDETSDPFGPVVGRGIRKTPQGLPGASTPQFSVARTIDENLGHTRVNNRRKGREDSARSSQRSSNASLVVKPALQPTRRSSVAAGPVPDFQDEDVQFVGSSHRSNGNEMASRKPRINNSKSPPAKQFGPASYMPEVEPRLSQAFRRDDQNVSKESAPRISPRVKPNSNGSGRHHTRRSSDDSIDELSISQTTVGSHIPRQTAGNEPRETASSRLKMSRATSRDVVENNADTGTDVRPFAVFQKAQQMQKSQFVKGPAKKEQRIQIRRILCRACCSEEHAVLLWMPDDRVFHVEVEGELQQIPGRDKLVEIGRNVINTVEISEGEDSQLLHIKGPVNEVSNGHILLDFGSPGTRRDFLRLILSLTGDQLREELVDNGRMERIFSNLGIAIRKDHVKSTLAVAGCASADNASWREPKAQYIHQSAADEEQIMYENDNSTQARLTKRRRMRTESSSAAPTLQVKSPYFVDEGQQPRRSSRQSKPTATRLSESLPPARWSRENEIQPWSHPVVYPFEGSKSRVTVDFQDIERLDEGEFLNDNLISFALRRIEENMDTDNRRKVRFFNSFFYETLTNKNSKKGFYYDAVSRWTKDKDLLSFQYVIVPICISQHWFVLICCNLDRLPRQHPESDVKDEANDLQFDGSTRISPSSMLENPDSDNMLLDRLSPSELIVPNDNIVEANDGGLHGDDERMELDSPPIGLNGKKSKRKAPPSRRYDPSTPAIITLDSFGSAHSGEVRNLKEYLKIEAASKRGMSLDTSILQGVTAKGIPEQSNYCDCGVFLIGYIEKFAKDPRKFVTKVLQKELDRQSDFADFDSSAKRAELRESLLKLNEEQAAQRRARKAAKKPAAVVQSGKSTALSDACRPSADAAKASTAIEQLQSPQVAADREVGVWTKQSTEWTANGAVPQQEDELDEMLMDVPRPLLSPSVTAPTTTADALASGANGDGIPIEVLDSQ